MPKLRYPSMLNALTVDVEEYFHPTEVRSSADLSQWTLLPSRIEAQTKVVLDLLERHQVRATFFILGWVADHRPRIVREIAAAGHEIGCHSYGHELVFDLTPQIFRRETQRAVRAIEAACGVTPRAYRAPSYSITERSLWALEILVECGFTHDSSIYPIYHDRYGIPGFGRHAQTLQTPSGPILEIPIATVQLSADRVAPVGGGGYLRLLPYCYTAAGLRRINNTEKQPACIYFHPWELDTEQPRLARGVVARLRTYSGLKSVSGKLERLLGDFRFSTVGEVYPFAGAPLMEISRAVAG
jgi:polysaccharide deacetylase family protein (PEP-CTERM system associated)